MSKIEETLKNKLSGLYYGNRIILPFKAHFLKVIVDSKIIMDFSPGSKGIYVREEENFTDLYFNDYEDLKSSVTKYEAIKMVVVEKGNDVFNFDNHIKVALYIEDKHKVRIEPSDHDIIFLE